MRSPTRAMRTLSLPMRPLPGKSGSGSLKLNTGRLGSSIGRGECGRVQPMSDVRRDRCCSLQPECASSQIE
jgi:hypothetical protein